MHPNRDSSSAGCDHPNFRDDSVSKEVHEQYLWGGVGVGVGAFFRSAFPYKVTNPKTGTRIIRWLTKLKSLDDTYFGLFGAFSGALGSWRLAGLNPKPETLIPRLDCGRSQNWGPFWAFFL